jgi:hypothetical protein
VLPCEERVYLDSKKLSFNRDRDVSVVIRKKRKEVVVKTESSCFVSVE